MEDNLLAKMKYYYPSPFYEVLERAYTFAKTAHANQKRASGEDYFIHPYFVAEILVDLGLDTATVAAAFLHDVVEDTPVTREQLSKEFGEEICMLVDGVTKLDKITFSSKEEEQAENIRKMFVAMAKDVRVVLIKLADRLHNMRSLQYLSEARRIAMAKETLDIYAPIAGRLGMSSVKSELQDLCLKYLDTEAYTFLTSVITEKRSERFALVESIIADLQTILKENNVTGEVLGRPKHFYSIYKKMKNQNKTIDEIYDLIAVRILVDSVPDCYHIFGAIHARWKPIPGRIKDYIATPKANGYQSLHTTVMTNYGSVFEIQIRTYEMHKIAEYGIAAHWKYKEGVTKDSDFTQNLAWIREMMEVETQVADSKSFLQSLKGDLVSGEVLVFTPKGDVVSLPEGATPIDFAYHIHSAVGNRCVGAKVNGKMVKLDTTLQVGDVVDIITSSASKGPSWDWLRVAKSSAAKAKIRQFFKKERLEENAKKGKEMLELEAKRKGYALNDLLEERWLKLIYERYSFLSLDEVCAAVGYGAITTNQVLYKLIEQYKRENVKKPEGGIAATSKSQAGTVLIKGYDDFLYRLAGCCNPVPGDSIVGFISRGRGICIHRADCSNLRNEDPARLVDAEWAGVEKGVFSVSLRILSEDSPQLIMNITTVIANMQLSMTSLNARLDKKGRVVIDVTVQIKDISDKDKLVARLLELKPVSEVYRG
ncbi:MAG: bifunctional (p)ppGpp synthetase/guanosine-3',5'-bis(diphosphate) 3'-pyrophosphohydrolase [Clostridia bacterium]|nr:bifunctional (p)ppGpp synthetase/guanosine-3',5'-bis(diphosphate) 3'-pyrophosphohydrolase [Clostridia bacterium]